jgi:hypothetical protein
MGTSPCHWFFFRGREILKTGRAKQKESLHNSGILKE